MAFGSTGILDDFNRANGQPGANWSLARHYAGGTLLFAIENNQARNSTDYNFSYYNPSTYGSNSEVYITAVVRTTITNDGPYLGIRMVNPGDSTLDGYLLTVENSGTAGWKIYRMDNGAITQLGLTVDLTISNGDKIGLEAIGGTLKGYRYTSGAWSEVISRDDATYSAAGYLGLYIGADDPNQRYDDFGGGNLEEGGCVNVITQTVVVVQDCP